MTDSATSGEFSSITVVAGDVNPKSILCVEGTFSWLRKVVSEVLSMMASVVTCGAASFVLALCGDSVVLPEPGSMTSPDISFSDVGNFMLSVTEA